MDWKDFFSATKIKIAVFVILAVLGIPSLIIHFLGSPYIMISTSMEPTIYQYDFVFVEQSDDYEIGDIAIFETGWGSKIIHRIVNITDEGYIFKGDNNPVPNPTVVQKEQIIGKLTFVYPLWLYILYRVVASYIIACLLIFLWQRYRKNPRST